VLFTFAALARKQQLQIKAANRPTAAKLSQKESMRLRDKAFKVRWKVVTSCALSDLGSNWKLERGRIAIISAWYSRYTVLISALNK